MTSTTNARLRDHTPPTGNPAELTQLSLVQAYVLGIVICASVKPMISSAMRGRELTLKEAYAEVAGCVLPFVGGWLVNRYFPEQWNYLPMERHPLDLSIKGY